MALPRPVARAQSQFLFSCLAWRLRSQQGIGIRVGLQGKEVLIGVDSRGAIALGRKSRAKTEPGEREFRRRSLRTLF